MRIAVFVLSLIGGLIGLFGTMGGLGLAAVGSGLAETSGDAATAGQLADTGGLILLGFIASIVNIVAGSLVLARRSPRRWGAVNIGAAVVGFLTAGGFYLFGGVLAFAAGLLSLLVRPNASEAPLPSA